MRKLIFVGLAQVLLVLTGCGGGGGGGISTSTSSTGGGGGSGSPASNSIALVVDSGPDPSASLAVDTPFITVTVCAPGSTTNCQQIDHVEVDTGSYGLRIISSVLNSSLASALKQETAASGQSIVECTQFIDGYSWGPVKLADMQVGGESAHGIPVQVIGDPAYQQTTSEVPTTCSSTGIPENTVASFGANGIIGVGPFASDCGSRCQQDIANTWYYQCPATGWSSSNACTGATVNESAQVTNPVVFFQTDNNGVIVQLPSVPDPNGAATATGSLVFGIGTEGNNGLNGATVLTADPNTGDITTTYKNQSLPESYFDTGSNAYYFVDSSITTCPSSGGSGTGGSWLCPSTELSLNVTNSGQNGTVSNVTINVANADSLFKGSNTAFDDLGASSGSQSSYCLNSTTNCSFDFGLPFFFGRSIYVAIAGANTSGGQGPYFAY